MSIDSFRPWRQRPRRSRYRVSHLPTRMSKAWLARHGAIEARVTPQGGLLLSHPKQYQLPFQVWHDLRQATLVYYCVVNGTVDEVQGARQRLSAWLLGGRQAETLVSVPPGPGLRVPDQATSAALVYPVPVGKDYRGEVLCITTLRRGPASRT